MPLKLEILHRGTSFQAYSEERPLRREGIGARRYYVKGQNQREKFKILRSFEFYVKLISYDVFLGMEKLSGRSIMRCVRTLFSAASLNLASLGSKLEMSRLTGLPKQP